MLRAWVESVMGRATTGAVPSLYRTAMTVPSMCYKGIIRARHALYDYHLLPTYTVSVPIISVGNLVCGGAGKTQVVMLFAELLMERGWKLGIVSRGYGGSSKEASKVNFKTSKAKDCGDEPLMMARRLKNAIVVTGRDRVKAAELAVDLGAQIILLDDGMQHRRIGRDLEIVVVDGKDPLAAKEFVPKGNLREIPSRLRDVDLVVSVGPLSEPFNDIPYIEVKIVPIALYNSDNRRIKVPQKVALFCGIGSPQRFIQTMHSLGSEVVTSHFLADHEQISQEILDEFAEKARVLGANMIVCTEKDWVKGKLKSLLPIGWLRTKMEVVHGSDTLTTVLMKEWV